MQATMVPGVFTWSRWQPDRSLYFNSWFVAGEGGNFVVDPLEPDADDLVFVEARGIAAVVVTNRDHERSAALFAHRFGVPVIAAQPDADEMQVPVGRVVAEGDVVFGWSVRMLTGFKTRGEFVLLHRPSRSAISGDAFWGVPAGRLQLMPDDKLVNPRAAALSARLLLAFGVRHLLVGDGMPIYEHAWEALMTLLDGREDLFARRINLDELKPIGDESPRPFTATFAEVGLLIGAKRLGYALGHLEPGDVYCPYHWHTREEEALLVWRGTPTMRTPTGRFSLRPGDVVAFPTGGAGAHRLSNESDAPCEVLIFANTDEGDVCFYPDSRKLLVDHERLIVRSEPELDYFDGE